MQFNSSETLQKYFPPPSDIKPTSLSQTPMRFTYNPNTKLKVPDSLPNLGLGRFKDMDLNVNMTNPFAQSLTTE